LYRLARLLDAFLNGYAQLASRDTVDAHDVDTVRLWLNEIRPKAIYDREAEYVDHDGDLVPILPKSRSPFRKFLEDAAILRAPILRNFFSIVPPMDNVDLRNEDTLWVHHNRVDKLSASVISLAGLAMLIGPLWILASVKDMNERLGIISQNIPTLNVRSGVPSGRPYFLSGAGVYEPRRIHPLRAFG
jgi:hypothetical protein